MNDSLGHSVGDDLLCAVGDRLRNAVRPGDTVARLGGDEFAILLEDEPTIEHLKDQAERILRSLAEPFELAGKSLVVTASAGVTLNRPGDGPEELIRNADMAMYLAKRDGKSCVRRFDPALHHAAVDRLELEADLRRALQRGERDELRRPEQPATRVLPAHERLEPADRAGRRAAPWVGSARRARRVRSARRRSASSSRRSSAAWCSAGSNRRTHALPSRFARYIAMSALRIELLGTVAGPVERHARARGHARGSCPPARTARRASARMRSA